MSEGENHLMTISPPQILKIIDIDIISIEFFFDLKPLMGFSVADVLEVLGSGLA